MNRLLEILCKIGVVLIYLFFAIIFAVSLYFNFLYIKDHFRKSDSGNQNSSLKANYHTGKVISINNDLIMINDGKSDSSFVIDKNTKFTKTSVDPKTLGEKIDDSNIANIKVGMQAMVLSGDSEKLGKTVALRVDYIFSNCIIGTIKSISSNKIETVVAAKDKDSKNYAMTYNSSTSYLKRQMKDSVQKNESLFNLNVITLADIQVNKTAMIFFEGNINENNQIISEIVLLN